MKDTIATNEVVAQAAQELETAGQRVSVRAIHQHIGGGSYKTISAAMRRWNEQKQHESENIRQLSDIPESMNRAFDELKLKLWQSAFAETQTQIAAVEIKFKKEISALQKERDALLQDLEDSKTEADNAALEKIELITSINMLKSELEQAKASVVQAQAEGRAAKELAAVVERQEAKRITQFTDLSNQMALLMAEVKSKELR